MDEFEIFLIEEISFAEIQKEQEQSQMMRMTWVGSIASFKAALVVYRRIKEKKNG